MKFWFSKWKIALGSGVDSLLSSVEDHEAAINAVLREGKQAAAQARVKLERVKRDGENLRECYNRVCEAASRWQERAVAVAETDRDRARECLRRRNRAEREKTQLERDVGEHRELERKLQADLRKIRNRLTELEQRKHALSARDFRSRALAATDVTAERYDYVDDTFERWEVKIAEREIVSDFEETGDDFATAFDMEEADSELDAELDQLVTPSKKD